MTDYSLGFLFSRDASEVLLIEKKKPAWQAGLLNGIGGHIEAGEHALDAMIREAYEEAGVTGLDWAHYLTLRGTDWRCHAFKAFLPYGCSLRTAITQREAEKLVVCSTDHVLLRKSRTVSNVPWIVSMVFDENHGRPALFDTMYIDTRW